ncbi:MAG: CDP-glycerol glycerophosphotransferase family protein, partial [Firmicutes bacterium]|nr:CDP-glycerol glycerophosphotransferase family protein [Bacillota bacterium]
MERMAPSGIRKVNEKALAMERAGETVLHFEIGRPDFDTPEYIKKAAIESLNEGNVFYTSNFGTMELRQAIADKLRRENGLDYKATDILVTDYSSSIFEYALLRRPLILLVADLAVGRHDLAGDERQRDEDRRDHHRRKREEDLDPVVAQPTEPA